MDERPYSPASLAKRWQCSAQLVRNMLDRGELKGFRHGKMWRIPAAEVSRYEAGPASPPDTPEQVQKPAIQPWNQEPAQPVYGWPQAMVRRVAAAYCGLSIAGFEREISNGNLPTPFVLDRREHWYRPSIDAALLRLSGGSAPKPEWLVNFEKQYGTGNAKI